MTRKITLLLLAVLAVGALEACGGGSAVNTPTSVTVSPKLVEVAAGVQNQSFTATLAGGGMSAGVTWSVDGVANGNSTLGTISGSGVYSAPATAGTHTITATAVADNSKSDNSTVQVTDLAGVFTYHNDLSRDGANTQEYLLSATTVTQSTFGKLFSCPVDGAVYTQPLWVPGVSINGTLHNVIYVATQHDSVYAFDADANPCVKLWQVNLLDTLHGGTPGETPVVWNDEGNCFGDIYPEVGVTGTPVIDPVSSTIYLVSASEIGGAISGSCSGSSGTFFHRLHALDLISGSERFNAPSTIAASVPGAGDGSSGGMINFSSQLHHNRSGLLLSGSVVYVPFAAHEDASPYHGWLLGYNALNVQVQHSVFNTTPNGGLGGIWAGGGAPAVDATGDLYVTTGNGIFDANSTTVPFNDYGDSILRLSPFPALTSNGVNLSLVGWFTPWDQAAISSVDADLGSGAVVLLPDQLSGPPHLLAQIGKGDPNLGQAIVFLIDRDNMGQFNTGGNNNQIVQSFPATCCGLWGAPAFWQNGLYFAGAYDGLKVFTFDPSTGLFNTTASSQSGNVFNFPDATPSISSQGDSNGIVWAIDSGLYGYASPNAAGGINCYVSPVPAACTGPAVLHAYSATNLATEYWNSAQATSNRDQAGNAVKFTVPTVANGKVYVSTQTEIDVYGVLP